MTLRVTTFTVMGVSWVFEHKDSAVDVERYLEVMGADPCGTYSVDCLPYNPSNAVGTTVSYVLHHSQYPQTSFAIAPTENLKNSPRAICDRGFDLILLKMSSGLTADTPAKFELAGREYRFRDFVVRVGTASQVTAVKGVIVEVEYEPSMVASQSGALLSEFMNIYFPSYNQKPDMINKTSPEPYTALDTVFQYLQIFKNMRSRA